MPASFYAQHADACDEASRLRPRSLIGRRIEVENLGVGLVVDYHKALRYLERSCHSVDFKGYHKGQIGVKKILLRRSQGVIFWNSGLCFRVLENDEVLAVVQNEVEKEALAAKLSAVTAALESTVSFHERTVHALQESHDKSTKQQERKIEELVSSLDRGGYPGRGHTTGRSLGGRSQGAGASGRSKSRARARSAEPQRPPPTQPRVGGRGGRHASVTSVLGGGLGAGEEELDGGAFVFTPTAREEQEDKEEEGGRLTARAAAGEAFSPVPEADGSERSSTLSSARVGARSVPVALEGLEGEEGGRLTYVSWHFSEAAAERRACRNARHAEATALLEDIDNQVTVWRDWQSALEAKLRAAQQSHRHADSSNSSPSDANATRQHTGREARRIPPELQPETELPGGASPGASPGASAAGASLGASTGADEGAALEAQCSAALDAMVLVLKDLEADAQAARTCAEAEAGAKRSAAAAEAALCRGFAALAAAGHLATATIPPAAAAVQEAGEEAASVGSAESEDSVSELSLASDASTARRAEVGVLRRRLEQTEMARRFNSSKERFKSPPRAGSLRSHSASSVVPTAPSSLAAQQSMLEFERLALATVVYEYEAGARGGRGLSAIRSPFASPGRPGTQSASRPASLERRGASLSVERARSSSRAADSLGVQLLGVTREVSSGQANTDAPYGGLMGSLTPDYGNSDGHFVVSPQHTPERSGPAGARR